MEIESNNDLEDYIFQKHTQPPKCENTTTIGDSPIQNYSENQIILYENEKGNIYCFKYDEIDYLLKKKVNPFDKTPLNKNFLKLLKKEKQNIKYSIPIYPKTSNIYYHPGTCPRLVNIDNKTGYIISHQPIKCVEDLPEKINILHSKTNLFDAVEEYEQFELKKNIFITTSYDASDTDTIKYIYKILSDNEIFYGLIDFVERKDISSLIQIYVPIEMVEKNKNLPDDEELIHDFTNFLKNAGENIPQSSVDKFQKLDIKLKDPVKVYRGLSFDSRSFLRTLKVGEKIKLGSKNRVQSWTTNNCVAEQFSSTKKYGMIVSTILDPEDILIDTRLLEERPFNYVDQREIMSIPTHNNKEKEFNVTIEAITKGTGLNRITDIFSLKYYGE